MSSKKILTAILLIILVFSLPVQFSLAKADDLVIMDDGRVILFITADSDVLAESTSKASDKPSPKPAAPPAPARAVPLVPAHTENTVKITPPINNDKKVQVTITPQVTPPVSPSKPSSVSQQPVNTITKTVDRVVEQGAGGQPVISIKSDKAKELTIQQGTIEVKTSSPLQINTVTHGLSVSPSQESGQISVLPKEAVQGALNKGLIDTKSVDQAKVSLTKDSSGVTYTVQSEKTGKLFGILDVKSPVEVKLSAQNGKVIKTSQSPLFTIFGNFIR